MRGEIQGWSGKRKSRPVISSIRGREGLKEAPDERGLGLEENFLFFSLLEILMNAARNGEGEDGRWRRAGMGY